MNQLSKTLYHENFMKKALRCARLAEKSGDVPVGCVIVKAGKIVSAGWNMRERKRDSTLHAEIIAIQRACKKLKDWRLEGCDIYITLEPCPMCAGAILQARFSRVYIGSPEYNTGSAGTMIDIFDKEVFENKIELTMGLCFEECLDLIQKFFVEKRYKKS